MNKHSNGLAAKAGVASGTFILYPLPKASVPLIVQSCLPYHWALCGGTQKGRVSKVVSSVYNHPERLGSSSSQLTVVFEKKSAWSPCRWCLPLYYFDCGQGAHALHKHYFCDPVTRQECLDRIFPGREAGYCTCNTYYINVSQNSLYIMYFILICGVWETYLSCFFCLANKCYNSVKEWGSESNT